MIMVLVLVLVLVLVIITPRHFIYIYIPIIYICTIHRLDSTLVGLGPVTLLHIHNVSIEDQERIDSLFTAVQNLDTVRPGSRSAAV